MNTDFRKSKSRLFHKFCIPFGYFLSFFSHWYTLITPNRKLQGMILCISRGWLNSTQNISPLWKSKTIKYCTCVFKCYLNLCSAHFSGHNIPKMWLDYFTTALHQYPITAAKHQEIHPHGIHLLRWEKNVFSLNMQGSVRPFNFIQVLCCSSLFTELS